MEIQLDLFIGGLIWLTLFTYGFRGQMLGDAEVRITNLELCPDSEQDVYSIDLLRRKLNRTTEAYSGNTSFDIWIDDTVSFYGNAAKLVDGGYKQSAYEMNDTNACEYFMKYFKDSFREVLRLAGIEEKCPIAPGTYSVTDFVIDYDTLPNVIYGDFRVDAMCFKDNVRLLCLRVYVTAKPRDTKPGFNM